MWVGQLMLPILEAGTVVGQLVNRWWRA